MKSRFKHVWLWIAVGGAVVLLVFCAVWTFYPRAGENKATPEVAGTAAGNPRPGAFPTNEQGRTDLTLTRPAATLSRPTRVGQWDIYPQPGSFIMALTRSAGHQSVSQLPPFLIKKNVNNPLPTEYGHCHSDELGIVNSDD